MGYIFIYSSVKHEGFSFPVVGPMECLISYGTYIRPRQPIYFDKLANRINAKIILQDHIYVESNAKDPG